MEHGITQLLSHVGGNPQTMRQLLQNAGAGDTPDGHMLQGGSASVAAAVERCARYRHIARALVERVAQLLGLNEGGVEGFLVVDAEHGRYLAVSINRARKRWNDAAFLHIHVSDDGQVVVEWNGTEADIGAALVAEGVREDDIVRGC